MQPIRKEQITMLALSLAGGRPLSKVQLQKAVFLLQEQLPEPILLPHPKQRYEFEKYNYGAFCRDVYTDAYKLSRQGLAIAEPDSPRDFKTIAANEYIERHTSSILRYMPFEVYTQAQAIVEWVLKQDFPELVSEMYSQYPEYKEKSIFRRVMAGIEAAIDVFAASKYPEIVPELIQAGYEVRDRLNVQRFLREHSFLVSLLYEALGKIKEYFPEASVRLEIFQDPESEDRSEHLFARIGTDLGPREATSKLKQLQAEWWLDKLPDARGQMTIGIEYL